ncbi:ceramidase domain-containing protein [uncultured Roseibium sp.]|uniref:ceramidase domain-containing protein n=1 Tax=uncultured Roseibium sp. TaxID=1936171 RepID=UPI003217BCFA
MTLDLGEQVDRYCERLGPEFWAEPLNAVTNAAFLIAAIAAFLMWRKKTPDDRVALALIGVVFLTGIGSFLFHTFATRWAGMADVIPIVVFIHFYLLIALKRFLGLSWVLAGALVIGFFVMSPGLGEVWAPIVGSSAFYLPALLAIFAVGIAFWRIDNRLGRDLLLTGVLFAVSVTFRALDMPLCADVTAGTHFLWHIFNSLVLFSLLRVLILHRSG